MTSLYCENIFGPNVLSLEHYATQLNVATHYSVKAEHISMLAHFLKTSSRRNTRLYSDRVVGVWEVDERYSHLKLRGLSESNAMNLLRMGNDLLEQIIHQCVNGVLNA